MFLMCVFEGHVRDWRQKIQRTKGETGKVKQIVLLQPAAICLWLNDHHNTHLDHFHREKELAKVTIKKEDVELIVSIQKCIFMLDSCLFWHGTPWLCWRLPDRWERWRFLEQWRSAVWENTWEMWWRHWLHWPTDCFEMYGHIGLPFSCLGWPFPFHTVLIL